MERGEWTAIAHADIDLMNPLPVSKLDEVLDVLDLKPGALEPGAHEPGALEPGALEPGSHAPGSHEPGARVLDLGCGKGELLVRIAARYSIEGTGVDRSAALLAEARRRAPDGLTFVDSDLTTFVAESPFDLAAALGASVDGYRAMLARLTALVRPGGLVLLGEGYWRGAPSDAYLSALEATRDELPDYAGLFEAAAEHGLEPRYAVTASTDDFDRYEWHWSLNGERYAAAHPDEPGVEEFLGWIRNGRRRYVELGGRDTLGFGLFLFARVA